MRLDNEKKTHARPSLKRYQGNEISKFSHLQKCDNKEASESTAKKKDEREKRQNVRRVEEKKRVEMMTKGDGKDDGVCRVYSTVGKPSTHFSENFNYGRNKNPFHFTDVADFRF